MKTILFLLQEGQFSAVIGDKRCNLRGGESMSFVEFDSEKIVESFENSDNFKGWNNVQLFILYDSESAKYLFNIIDAFELKNKVGQCKNFSFQIKLEEKPIDLNGNVEELLKYLENGDAVVIAEKDKEIKALKKEVDTLRSEFEQKERKINDLSQEVTSLNNDLKQVEEKEKELKSKVSELEESPLFIDKGDYIDLSKLTKPICNNIHMIEKELKPMDYFDAEEYVRNLRIGGFDDWRLPDLNDFRIISEIGGLYSTKCWPNLSSTCWLSSERKSGEAVCINKYNVGCCFTVKKTEKNYVMCVR